MKKWEEKKAIPRIRFELCLGEKTEWSKAIFLLTVHKFEYICRSDDDDDDDTAVDCFIQLLYSSEMFTN